MSMSTAPAISIILPAYNVAAYIGGAIASIKAQGFTDFEVLCIDDGSTDATRANAMAAIGQDERFRILSQPNAGLSAARNVGLDLARGEVVAFLDGDDGYDPDFLAILYHELQATDADWVASAIAFCTPNGDRHFHSAIHGRPEPEDQPQPRDYTLSSWPDVIAHFPSAWNKLYRRSFIGDIRFDAGIWFEDHAFFQSLAARSSRLRHVPVPLYRYTLEREGQITRADSDRVFDQFTVLDRCAQIMQASTKPQASVGLARLATRLCNERLDAISDPQRRARFLAGASAFFSSHGLKPDWAWDRYLDPLTSCALTGQPPVIIRFPPDSAALATAPPQNGGRSKLVAHLPTARQGCFGLASWTDPVPDASLVLDLPAPCAVLDFEALSRLATDILRGTASAAVLALRPADHVGPETWPGIRDTGPNLLDPETAITFRPDRHALLIRSDCASQMSDADPQIRLIEQAFRLMDAKAAIVFAPEALICDAPIPLTATRHLLDGFRALSRRFGHLALPEGWDRRLWLRAATTQLAMRHGDGRRARHLLTLLAMGWTGLRLGWIGAPGAIDDTTRPILRRLFRVAPKQ